MPVESRRHGRFRRLLPGVLPPGLRLCSPRLNHSSLVEVLEAQLDHDGQENEEENGKNQRHGRPNEGGGGVVQKRHLDGRLEVVATPFCTGDDSRSVYLSP